MSPLTSYRRLFALAGPLYVLVAFLGRLPAGDEPARHAAAGLRRDRQLRRWVARRPGPWPSPTRSARRWPATWPTGSASAAWSSSSRWPAPPGWSPWCPSSAAGTPWPVQAGAAAVTGLVLPQVGPPGPGPVEADHPGRGPHQRRLVDAAFSYEGAAIEASFVLGPALVGGLAAVVAPGAALVCGRRRPGGLRQPLRRARERRADPAAARRAAARRGPAAHPRP